MLIFKVASSSLIHLTCHPSPLHIHLNSTNLGLETHRPPKSLSLEDLVLPEGLYLSPGAGVRTQLVWGQCSRAAAQKPRKWHEVTNLGGPAPCHGTQHGGHGPSHPTPALPPYPCSRLAFFPEV